MRERRETNEGREIDREERKRGRKREREREERERKRGGEREANSSCWTLLPPPGQLCM